MRAICGGTVQPHLRPSLALALLLILAACQGPSPTAPATACVVSAEIRPVRRVEPVYPARAHKSGTEGWADVEGDIQANGTVANVAIADSFPGSLFARATTDAFREWEYVVPQTAPCFHVKVRFTYSLEGGQMDEAQTALNPARQSLLRCEYESAAHLAVGAREGSRNPQVYLESLLIESAAREMLEAGSAGELLSAYVRVAPDTSSAEAARRRARGYVPSRCRPGA